VVLSGCVTTPTAKLELERAVRNLLQPAPFTSYRFRNDIIVDLLK
jgi:hypothetical protein